MPALLFYPWLSIFEKQGRKDKTCFQMCLFWCPLIGHISIIWEAFLTCGQLNPSSSSKIRSFLCLYEIIFLRGVLNFHNISKSCMPGQMFLYISLSLEKIGFHDFITIRERIIWVWSFHFFWGWKSPNWEKKKTQQQQTAYIQSASSIIQLCCKW